VFLICATRGESGKITDPNIDPHTDKAILRERELKRLRSEGSGAAFPNHPWQICWPASSAKERLGTATRKACGSTRRL
jgi:hypothetical protein